MTEFHYSVAIEEALSHPQIHKRDEILSGAIYKYNLDPTEAWARFHKAAK